MSADPKLSIVAPEFGRRDRITADRVRDEDCTREHLRRGPVLALPSSDGAQRFCAEDALGGEAER